MRTLKDLEWKVCSKIYSTWLEKSETDLYCYVLKADKGKFKICYYDIANRCTIEETGFTTMVCAKKWCFKNFEKQMKPYLNYPK